MAAGYNELYEHYDNNYDKYNSDGNIKLDDFIAQTGDFLDSKEGISLISEHDVVQGVLLKNIKDENLTEQLSKDISIENCEKYNSDADIKLEDSIVEAGDFGDSKAGISLISDINIAQGVLLENIKDEQLNNVVDSAENWEIGFEKIEIINVETCARNENVPMLQQDPLLEDNESHVKLEVNRRLSIKGNSKYISRKNRNRIVLCKKYNRIFDNRYNYRVQVHNHAGNTPYKCDICQKGFVTAHLLKKHKVLHSESTPSSYKIRGYTCNYCGLTCYRMSDMTKHVRTHTGERPFICEFCKKSFCRRSALKHHIRIHTGDMPFTCEICKMSFRWRGGLMRHIKEHTGERPFSCEFCEKSFSEKSRLTTHIKTHTGEKPFTCEVCKTSFCRKSVLITHIRIHTGEKPFTCEVCRMSFRQSCVLRRHIKTHTGEKPFTCEICKESFSEKNRLMSHTRTHTGEKPFTCKFCKKPFRWRSGLRSHIRTHTGEKSFICEVCKQAFGRSSGLKSHMRVHMGDCPHSCELCSAKFKSTKSLIRHIRLHIKEKD